MEGLDKHDAMESEIGRRRADRRSIHVSDCFESDMERAEIWYDVLEDTEPGTNAAEGPKRAQSTANTRIIVFVDLRGYCGRHRRSPSSPGAEDELQRRVPQSA